MQRLKLALTAITIEDRQRQDLGDLTSLKDSMQRLGLIQPVVIDQNNRLIAGGRRCTAAKELGWLEIDVVYRETLNEDELFEMELVENTIRKDMTWGEKVHNIAMIHRLKAKRAALDGSKWLQKQTGELLGTSQANVSYALTLSDRLKRDPNGPIATSNGPLEAIRLLVREAEDAANAELARRTAQVPTLIPNPTQADVLSGAAIPNVETLSEEVGMPSPDGEVNDLNPPVDSRPPLVVPLSQMLHLGDCLDILEKFPEGSIDHCLTDPPYAIDMRNLSQENSGMEDIVRVEDEHDVDQNLGLLHSVLPKIHRVLKENAFCAIWCDTMVWHVLYRRALEVGFKVQRWPVIWHKTHPCLNQAAQFNTTKNFEFVMLLRKGNATLVEKAPSSIMTYAKGQQYRGYHPFYKPFDVWDWLIEHLTLEGQVILDPFCGEGSCLISCLGEGRKPIGIEVKDLHYNVALEAIRDRYRIANPNVQFA